MGVLILKINVKFNIMSTNIKSISTISQKNCYGTIPYGSNQTTSRIISDYCSITVLCLRASPDFIPSIYKIDLIQRATGLFLERTAVLTEII